MTLCILLTYCSRKHHLIFHLEEKRGLIRNHTLGDLFSLTRFCFPRLKCLILLSFTHIQGQQFVSTAKSYLKDFLDKAYSAKVSNLELKQICYPLANMIIMHLFLKKLKHFNILFVTTVS